MHSGSQALSVAQSAQKLQQFRSKAYQLLGRAKDATFDLMDAVLVTRNIYSFAELSLSPVFRRKWPSLYEALDDCRPNRQKLMKLYLKEIPTSLERLIIAGDHTPWARTEAPTLKDRTYEHGAKVISGKPITLGHGYSTLAWIPEEKGSWALPKPMWLAWIGFKKLPLESLWHHYLKRFAIEHWNRFVKQRLHWRATPRRRKTQGNARAGQKLNWEPQKRDKDGAI